VELQNRTQLVYGRNSGGGEGGRAGGQRGSTIALDRSAARDAVRGKWRVSRTPPDGVAWRVLPPQPPALGPGTPTIQTLFRVPADALVTRLRTRQSLT